MKNYIEQKTLDDMVEDQIQRFLGEDIKHHFQLEQAKNEKWLGYADIRKNDFGLLGYYRTNIACQIQILQNLGNAVCIPSNHLCFASFFKSDWFKNTVLNNGYVSFNVYKKSHFEVIKNEHYYLNSKDYLKFYS
jgi:hypothetical protein